MSTKKTVIRGGQKILGSLASGVGDDILTKDPTTNDVGSIPPIDPSTYLTTTLASGKLFIGSAGNLATTITPTGAVLISNLGVTSISPNVILDANINTGAGIQYSKLTLTNSIVNNDIATNANISRSKIISGNSNRILINNGSGVFSEQAAITANRLLISDVNGLPIASAITSIQASYIDPTSSIQTQLNNRLSFSSGIAPSAGDLISFISGIWDRVPIGTAGQYLVVNGGGTGVQWATVSPGGLTNTATTNELAKSDGTNLVSSGIFSTTSGDITLGTGVSGTLRTITAAGSGSNIGILFQAKGTGNISLFSDITQIYEHTGTTGIQINPGSGSVDSQLTIAGLGLQLITSNTGNISILATGASYSFGTANPNFQSGVGIVYIKNNTSVPTGNPSGGGFLYVDSGALKYRGSSGTVTTIANA